VGDQADQEQNQEDKEAYLRNACCGKRHESKTEDASDQSDQQEYQGVVQHNDISFAAGYLIPRPF
jgi:hypothetical protein